MITDEFATKKDLDQGLLAMRAEMNQKFATVDLQFAALRTDMDQKFATVDLRFAATRADIQALDAKIDRIQDRLTFRLGGLIVGRHGLGDAAKGVLTPPPQPLARVTAKTLAPCAGDA